MQPPLDIAGWGSDASFSRRPGVPEEIRPPRPMVDGARAPAQQASGPPAVTSPCRKLTPVYSTAIPPRGLSGAIRKLAYEAPDYEARRWMLLLFADRIDVIEHHPVRLALAIGLAAAGIFGVRALVRQAIR